MKTVNIKKEELIGRILHNGNSMDLYKMLIGVSDYNQEQDCVEYSLEETKLISAARNHLSFVAKFGNKENHVVDGERLYFSYSEKFDEWIQAGAPGILVEELELCLSNLKR